MYLKNWSTNATTPMRERETLKFSHQKMGKNQLWNLGDPDTGKPDKRLETYFLKSKQYYVYVE